MTDRTREQQPKPQQPAEKEKQKGVDPKKSGRTPQTEPPKEKRRDDL